MTPISSFAQRTSEIEYDQRRFLERSVFLNYILGSVRGRSLDDLGSSKPAEVIRSAVASGDLNALKNSASAFVANIDEKSLIGALLKVAAPGTVGAPLLLVPDDITAHKIADGLPIPLDRINVAATTLAPSALKNLLLFDSRSLSGADARVRKGFDLWLSATLRRAWDASVTDALLAAAPVVGSGGSLTTISADIGALFASVSDGNPVAPVLIASARGIAYLATTANAAGLFDAAKIDGTGSVLGMPLLVSARCANNVLLLDAARLALADDGTIVEAASSASVQMDSSPTNSAATGVGSTLVSVFATNSTAIRSARYLSMALLADDACARITITALGGSPS